MESKEHWEKVYGTKSATEVSWFQEHADLSLKLIQDSSAKTTASIVDVGGGASVLVDDLLAHGYKDITVLDLSRAAIATAKSRLGNAARGVKWIEANILYDFSCLKRSRQILEIGGVAQAAWAAGAGADQFEWLTGNGGFGELAQEGQRLVTLEFGGAEQGEQQRVRLGTGCRAVLLADLAGEHGVAHLLLAPVMPHSRICRVTPQVGRPQRPGGFKYAA